MSAEPIVAMRRIWFVNTDLKCFLESQRHIDDTLSDRWWRFTDLANPRQIVRDNMPRCTNRVKTRDPPRFMAFGSSHHPAYSFLGFASFAARFAFSIASAVSRKRSLPPSRVLTFKSACSAIISPISLLSFKDAFRNSFIRGSTVFAASYAS